MRMALVCLAVALLLPAQPVSSTPADLPVERTDRNSQVAHQQLLAKKTQGRIDVYFEGDSIARRWGATDYPQLLENWRKNFFGWNAADFGWGADRVENILWRLQHGELDGVNPKAVVLLAGTNNVGNALPPEGIEAAASNLANGISAVLHALHDKAPNATIILMGIFPRNDNIAVMPEIDAINAKLSKMVDGRAIRYLNINDKLADSNGRLYEGMMNAGDKLHPTIKGYQLWADALKPLLAGILGPPGTEDLAPPPTGNPGVN
jgi:lysophospholipase L1-like esterase